MGLFIVMFVAFGAGCAMDGMLGGPMGDFGATPGGVQDMGFARELISEGQVPPAEAFLVEGMFSEHDLPLSGDACVTTLCLRSAMAVAPDEDEVQSAWLQVGFSSTIDPETFERPSVTVVAVVDVSGSMSGTPLDVSKEMLNALIDELGPNDRFGLVTYGSSVSTEVSIDDVDDRDDLHREVDRLSSNGSTNMEAGLDRAFALAIDDAGQTEQPRVWLFTDVRPNVGATTGSEFERMAATAADEGVGLTVFGVGLGLGQSVMTAMSHLRGGNAFSLFSTEDVDELMEESWPWMVSPIAYDFHATVTPDDGLELTETYGIPADDGSGTATLDVATIFLSRNRGAILARMIPWSAEAFEGELGVEIEMSYTTPDGEEFVEHQTPSIAYSVERSFSQPIVEKTVALAVLVRGMRAAATEYVSSPAAATATMELTLARIEADAASIADPELDQEEELARDMLELMRSGAPQGDLYSGSGY